MKSHIKLFFILSILGLIALFVVSFNIQTSTHYVNAEILAPKIQEVTVVPILPPVELKKVVTVAPKVVPKSPEAHLKIPQIGVDAVIKDMGVTPENNMAVPNNNIDVGWFSLGTRPGDTGSAVIGAHNRLNSKDGVFINLNKLKVGDVLSVVDAKGVSTSFVVRDMRTYDAKDTNTGIFQSTSGAHLNLITCSGEWDTVTKSSKQRLVVFTDAIASV